MKYLVVAPSWIGDAVLAQPFLKRLKALNPEAQLEVMASNWVAPVMARMPEVSAVFENPFGHGDLSLLARFRLGRRLAQAGYDRAYVLPNSLKSALVPFFARIPQRIGFTGESRYGLLNCRHTLNKEALPQMAERYAWLAEAPGTPLPHPLLPLHLTSTPEQQAAVLADLKLTSDRRPVVFCPGAEYGPAKRWPTAHFATLARVLGERGHAVWLLGGEHDRSLGDAIRAAAPRACRNLCGITSLDQAIDLIAQAELVVSNDSGLMHVAAGLSRPLIALYGSSSSTFTPPHSPLASTLSIGLPCSPCFQRTCPQGHLDCLWKLEPTRVLDACLSKLSP